MLSFPVLLVAVAGAAASGCSGCNSFPPSMVEFSSGFEQPEPPLIKAQFEAQFIQHKWDVNVSHITAGYIVNSPKHGFVRVDKADDTGLASSLFNYANVSRDGLVDNTLTTYLPGADKPDIWRGYVNSNFPIFPEDILVAAGASFSGLVDRNLVGRVAAWSFMYQGVIPVTAFVDSCNVLVGYDYLSAERRTRATTQLFSIRT